LGFFLFKADSAQQWIGVCRDFSLSGGYRAVFARPTNFAWSTVTYTDVMQSLIPNECGDTEYTPAAPAASTTPVAVPALVEKTAVLVEFTLPSSTYATMALREIMKIPTDVQHHVRCFERCRFCLRSVQLTHPSRKRCNKTPTPMPTPTPTPTPKLAQRSKKSKSLRANLLTCSLRVPARDFPH
jgi:hypothetical protein